MVQSFLAPRLSAMVEGKNLFELDGKGREGEKERKREEDEEEGVQREVILPGYVPMNYLF